MLSEAQIKRFEKIVAPKMARVFHQAQENDEHPSLDELQLTSGPITKVSHVDANDHYDNHGNLYCFLDNTTLAYTMAYYGQEYDDVINSPYTLTQAQQAKFALVADRAGVQDGMDILVPGCGFAGLESWLLTQFPNINVTSTGISPIQLERIREFKMDVNHPLSSNRHTLVVSENEKLLDKLPHKHFDIIITVGVTEHITNFTEWLNILNEFLKFGGIYFCHHIVSKHFVPSLLEAESSRTGFYYPGGMIRPFWAWKNNMGPFTCEQSWFINGTNYWRTLSEWEANFNNSLAQNEISLSPEGIDYWRKYFALCKVMFAVDNGALYGNGQFKYVSIT